MQFFKRHGVLALCKVEKYETGFCEESSRLRI
jgi:hypothetical protein